MSSPTAALTLLDLIQSQRITAVIYTAARLGLAELLRGGSRSSDELAAATGADHDSLGRLLTALCTIGLAARGSDGRYALTDVGAALDGTSEHSFKAWAIFEGEMLTKSWGGLV
jgi:predicted transcriptional regulator